MKSVFLRILAGIGLVPIRHYAALSRRADELNREVHARKELASRATVRADGIKTQYQKRVAQLKRTRAEMHSDAEWKTMQQRLDQAERALVAAREQLMAIEVKLDILEGAANVLDARTRTTLSKAQPDASLQR